MSAADTIRVQCPGCRKTLRADSQQAGKKVKCPGCGVRIAIPAPEAPANAGAAGSKKDHAKVPGRTPLV
jgi:DNA-directed RNA polymerase subunit RPC12/RpoP